MIFKSSKPLPYHDYSYKVKVVAWWWGTGELAHPTWDEDDGPVPHYLTHTTYEARRKSRKRGPNSYLLFQGEPKRVWTAKSKL